MTVLALISVGTMLNYLDRAVLGVAAPSMTQELGLDAVVMGIVFSAFSWTYAAAQIPGGAFLDRVGARLAYFWSVSIWSLFTLLQGFAAGLASLLTFRLGLGVAEAPCFPSNSRILSTWFPQQERARATGVYSIGQYFGLAFLSPVLFFVVQTMGWRALFIIAGLAGIVFAGIWLRLYREPHESKSVNQAELDYIEAGGGLGYKGPATPFAWRNIGKLLRHRQILGASIGQFAGNSTLVFFLTWFPTYLATERQMEFLKVGFYAVLPFIAASIGVLSGGWISDMIIKKTGSATLGRKLPILTGLLLASTIVGANFVDSNDVVIAILSVAFFGQGMVNLGWTLITDVAPKNLIGLTGGVFNLCANLAGIVTPIVIGVIVGSTGSFFGALAYIGVIAAIGALSYIFIVGEVRRVEVHED
ncbi:ACS family D-galactonate transporter-like MFS transporter [Povalibacter uvarum]|uniref:ACS family D-galactonate transporter-like MFS transporter n=1 Tax=Povalibacter uvarum TaxID=732238 RepID=A0A841HMW9_9GAMM|nr:MFS transporter [Povalibacter uvarum]MBB6093518.1 ACS family D-galactonate transporter-like MFS transporter [Povalibacter uvarum]